MSYFMPGLGLMVLGFGFFQFSNLFNLYEAGTKDGAPVMYWILRVMAYLFLILGLFTVVFSFLKAD